VNSFQEKTCFIASSNILKLLIVAVTRLGIMSTDRIEKLYKNFGILADSKDKSEVSLHLILIVCYLDPYRNERW
jgi:uncharacterized membrane protein